METRSETAAKRTLELEFNRCRDLLGPLGRVVGRILLAGESLAEHGLDDLLGDERFESGEWLLCFPQVIIIICKYFF